MVVAFALVTGVLVILVLGAVALYSMGMANVLPSLVPLAPWLVMVGTMLLIATEFLLFFGGKEDRRAAFRDLAYLIPTCLISAALYYGLQKFLW